MQTALLEHYGGMAFVSRLVLGFYDRVQASEVLRPYFAGTDMRRLIEHQAKFISTLLGGPVSYSDRQIAAIHHHLDIEDAAFEEMIVLLDATLVEFGFADEDRALVVGAFRDRRTLLVGRGPVG